MHTSTSEVYGSAKYSPIDEMHPINPQSPYAASKVSADALCVSYYKSFETPVTIIRPFNTFGPRQSSRAVIPTIIKQLIWNPEKLIIGNINTKRDFTYVDDTVNGFIQAIESKKKISGEIINLGTGTTISIKDIIYTISDILRIHPKLIRDKKRFRPTKSEVKLLISNNKKARNMISWKPKYSGKKGLRDALVETINWFKQNKKMFKDYKEYKV